MAVVFDLLRAIAEYWFRIKNGISWVTFWFQIEAYERVNDNFSAVCNSSIFIKSMSYFPLTIEQLKICGTKQRQAHRRLKIQFLNYTSWELVIWRNILADDVIRQNILVCEHCKSWTTVVMLLTQHKKDTQMHVKRLEAINRPYISINNVSGKTLQFKGRQVLIHSGCTV